MEERLIRVGITHGDINGIGYEVILKTFSDSRVSELCTPIIYGSSKIAAYHRKALDLPPLNMNIISRAEDAGVNRVNIINCVDDDAKVEFSKSTSIAGESAFKALETAVEDMKRGVVDVLLTAPINKHNIQNEHFHFPGHTEYLEKNFGTAEKKALMILMKGDLRVALVTGHIPLSQVASSIKTGDIVSKLLVFNRSLKQDFGIVKPRIAVLSLNPHAGDEGLLGTEEETIIRPAMQEAEKKGVLSFGPYAADGFFGARLYDKFDGVLAMYQTEYNKYTMTGIEIHQNRTNFGANVWYDDSTRVLVVTDTSRIYTCTSTNYDWKVTEVAQCTDGISQIATRDGFAYYLCNNEAKLQSIDIASNALDQSWDVLQNAVFTVSPQVIVVATNRQVRLIGEEEATISWEGESPTEVSYNNNIVAIRDNNTVAFLQVDDNDWVDKWSITPCGNGVNLAQFVGEGVYMVSCRNENIIRVWSVSDTVSQRQVNTVATAVLTLLTVLVLTASWPYLIVMERRRSRQARHREYVERLRSMQGELLFLG